MTVDRADLMLRARAARELQRRREQRPLDYWRPTPPQRDFLASTARYKLLRGPNQAGKTDVGAAELVYRMAGYNPWTGREHPRGDYRVLVYSWDQLKPIARKIWERVPKDRLHERSHYDAARQKWTGHAFMLKHRSGQWSRVDFTTVLAGEMGNASATLDGIWVDEPPPEHLWGELDARVRKRRGDIWLTMTPSPWKWPVEWLRGLVADGAISETHFGLTPENCTPLGGLPFYSEEEIERFRIMTPPSQRPMRLDGEWEGPAEGSVFEQWSRDTMLRPAAELWQDMRRFGKDVRIGIGIDHGVGIFRQVAVLVAAVGHKSEARVWVLDEYVAGGDTAPQQDARGIWAMLQRNGLKLENVDVWYGDRAHPGSQKKAIGRKTNEILMRQFVKMPDACPKGVFPGKILVPWKPPGSVDYGCTQIHWLQVQGNFKVSDSCTHVAECLDKWTGGEEHKDAIDAMRYGTIGLIDRRPMAQMRLRTR